MTLTTVGENRKVPALSCGHCSGQRVFLVPPKSQQIQPQPAQWGLASDRDAVGPTLKEMARALHSVGKAWPCLPTFTCAHKALLFSSRDDASLPCLTPACHLDFQSDFQQGAHHVLVGSVS